MTLTLQGTSTTDATPFALGPRSYLWTLCMSFVSQTCTVDLAPHSPVTAMEVGNKVIFEGLDGPFGRIYPMLMGFYELDFCVHFGEIVLYYVGTFIVHYVQFWFVLFTD